MGGGGGGDHLPFGDGYHAVCPARGVLPSLPCPHLTSARFPSLHLVGPLLPSPERTNANTFSAFSLLLRPCDMRPVFAALLLCTCAVSTPSPTVAGYTYPRPPTAAPTTLAPTTQGPTTTPTAACTSQTLGGNPGSRAECPAAFPYLSQHPSHNHTLCYTTSYYAMESNSNSGCQTWCSLSESWPATCTFPNAGVPVNRCTGSSAQSSVGNCVFPFTYGGTTYTGCADVASYGGVGWCAFDSTYAAGRWGYCTEDCPGYSSPSKSTIQHALL